jgi:peptidoglycan/LPS O-acetylase OafA/YrhL
MDMARFPGGDSDMAQVAVGAGSTVAYRAYRPHLDGLRTLAVYLVVLFHAGITQFKNGFIGVDIFFVLSGYLVTGILVADLKGPDRRIAFSRFYSRRARRLLPAAAVNLLVTAIVFGAIAAPVQLEDASAAIRAASLYFANWHFIAQSADYFAEDVIGNAVQHYWSLSVEEQFYLAWPLLLSGLWAVTRSKNDRQLHVVRAAMVCAAIVSFVLARMLAVDDLSRAYYGTDTRAYQLLAGAVLAISPGLAARFARSHLATLFPLVSSCLVAASLLLATHFIDLDPIWRGLAVTLVTCALLLSLEVSATGWTHRLLSRPTLVYLGKISYGTYLWHWLVILVLKHYTDAGPFVLAGITAVLATAIASLSYQLIELPIRTAPGLDSYRHAILVAALTSSVLVGLWISPLLLNRSSHGVQMAHGPMMTTGDAYPTRETITAAYMDFFDFGSCKVSGSSACQYADGHNMKAIVIGESHAAMLTPMLTEIAKRHDVALYAGYLSYCPWTDGIRYASVGNLCFRDQDDLFNRILPALDPDIVFLAHRPVDDPHSSVDLIDRDLGDLSGDPGVQSVALKKRITDVVKTLRADGRKVVIFEPIPVVAKKDNTLRCLSRATSVEECRFVTRSGPGGEETVFREMAQIDSGVISVDLDPLICPYLPICDPIVNGLIVKRDDNHLTQRFAQTLVDKVDEYLVAKGAFERER